MSVASRVADERSEKVGKSVGYSVRFESVLPRPFGSIMYYTTGMFFPSPFMFPCLSAYLQRRKKLEEQI